MKDEEKSIVLLTNFWDANILIDYGFMLFRPKGQKQAYKLNLIKNKIKERRNYSVHSIALSMPPLKDLSNLGKKEIDCIDHFCPTYDILRRYKNDKNWESYKNDYYKLLKGRRDDLKLWINSLKPQHVYILCCWENTATGAHCHREILFDIFNSSGVAKEKLFSVYRHGNKIYKTYVSDYEENVRMPLGIFLGRAPELGTIMGIDSEMQNITATFGGGRQYTAGRGDFQFNPTTGQVVTMNSNGEIAPLSSNGEIAPFLPDDIDDPPF